MKKAQAQKELKSTIDTKRIDHNYSSKQSSSENPIAKESKIRKNSGYYECNNLNGQITGVKIFSKNNIDSKNSQKLEITGSVLNNWDSESLQNFKQTRSKMSNKVSEKYNTDKIRLKKEKRRNLSLKSDKASIQNSKNGYLETPSLADVKASDAINTPNKNSINPVFKIKKASK